MYIVYLHVNKVNNKKYFGITSQNPLKRWNNGKNYSSKYFKNSILKYGWENFNHFIIKEGLTKTEACLLEIKLINKYNTTDQQYGYNISLGGDCPARGMKHSKEFKKQQSVRSKNINWTLEKRSNISKGLRNHYLMHESILKGRPQSSEHIKARSEALRGRKLSVDTRDKISKTLGGRLFKATNIETGEVIYSHNQTATAKKLNVRRTGLRRCLNNEQKQTGGYKFEYVN